MKEAAIETTVHTRMNHERSLGEIVAEIKRELSSFVSTRVRIIRAELQESAGALKFGLPMAMLGLALLATAGLLFTAAAVTVVASAFAGNPYALFYAFIIVGAAWTICGAIAAFFAVNQFKGRFPKRTLEVLKADKIWFQKEARGAKSHL